MAEGRNPSPAELCALGPEWLRKHSYFLNRSVTMFMLYYFHLKEKQRRETDVENGSLACGFVCVPI